MDDIKIFSSETIPQYKIISSILKSLNIDDERKLSSMGYKLEVLGRCTVILKDKNNNKKRYEYNEESNEITIKDVL